MGLDGTTEQADTSAQNGQHPGEQHKQPADEGSYKLRFCTVCASNNNRYPALSTLLPPSHH